jgi:hypothetical protein
MGIAYARTKRLGTMAKVDQSDRLNIVNEFFNLMHMAGNMSNLGLQYIRDCISN